MRKEISFDQITIFVDDHHPYTFGYYDEWDDNQTEYCYTVPAEVPKPFHFNYDFPEDRKLHEPGTIRLLAAKWIVDDIAKNTHRTFPKVAMIKEIRASFTFPEPSLRVVSED